MKVSLMLIYGFCVALRKESVDRNLVVALLAVGRAGVALRKESVDRNARLSCTD